jgi:hypothetical protein
MAVIVQRRSADEVERGLNLLLRANGPGWPARLCRGLASGGLGHVSAEGIAPDDQLYRATHRYLEITAWLQPAWLYDGDTAQGRPEGYVPRSYLAAEWRLPVAPEPDPAVNEREPGDHDDNNDVLHQRTCLQFRSRSMVVSAPSVSRTVRPTRPTPLRSPMTCPLLEDRTVRAGSRSCQQPRTTGEAIAAMIAPRPPAATGPPMKVSAAASITAGRSAPRTAETPAPIHHHPYSRYQWPAGRLPAPLRYPLGWPGYAR